MGGLNVKNTMVERVLQIIAPHPCSGCGNVGTILCEDCKYDIINEPFEGCILCGTPNPYGICSTHNSPITRAFTVSTRAGSLETVINKFNFQHTKGAARPLAELFDASLPIFSNNTLIVPIPTVRAHIRERGYDHVGLIARHLADIRSLCIEPLLVRRTNTTQHTVNREMREVQANEAFVLQDGVNVRGRTVVLIDDIVTTGSTLQAAAMQLTNAGAIVWAATLAYQPLD